MFKPISFWASIYDDGQLFDFICHVLYYIFWKHMRNLHLLTAYKNKPIAILALAILSGCVMAWGGSYNVESQDSSSILIKYDPAVTNLRNVYRVAEEHCNQFKENAVPQDVTKSAWAITTALFVCKNTTAPERAGIMRFVNAQGAAEAGTSAAAWATFGAGMQSMGAGMNSMGNAYQARANADSSMASTPTYNPTPVMTPVDTTLQDNYLREIQASQQGNKVGSQGYDGRIYIPANQNPEPPIDVLGSPVEAFGK
jgi:hypothetical protein